MGRKICHPHPARWLMLAACWLAAAAAPALPRQDPPAQERLPANAELVSFPSGDLTLPIPTWSGNFYNEPFYYVTLGILLLALLVGWETAGDRPATIAVDILVALSAGAMGIQAAAARRIAIAGVTTTFVTGTLTSLIAGFVAPGLNRSQSTRWAAALACMVIGAAAGAALFIAWRPGGPLVATLLVGMVLAVAAWATRPRD